MSVEEHVETGAERNRRLDTLLSAELGRPAPKGRAAERGYLGELEQRPPLSLSEERELVARARAGDAAAREQLVERLLPLVAGAARAYRSSASVQRVELIQEGVVGLLRAVERYDPQRGVPFRAYAGWWVRQAMQQLVSELTRPLVLSDRALRHLARLKEAHGAAVIETGREPDRDDLAERTGLSAAAYRASSTAHVRHSPRMARPGEVLDVPAIGVTIEFRHTTAETDGELIEFDLVGRPSGFFTQPHVHPLQDERHEVIEGRFWMRTGKLERLFGPGETVTTPAGVEHSHGTYEPSRIRVRVTPANRFEEWLERIASMDYFPGGWPKPADAARLLLDFPSEARGTTVPLSLQQAAARGVLKLAQSRR